MPTETLATKATRRLFLLIAFLLIISIAFAGFNAYVTFASPQQAAYTPSTVGFEGQLADSSGSPVTDGAYSVTFRLYSQASGGTALWTETQSVDVADGLYSVQLGTVTTLDADDFSGDRWLGIQVSGDSEMSPRIAISAVPFALNAQQAQSIQGYNVSTTAPQDSEALIWDDTTSEWKPGSAGASTFADLTATGSNETPENFMQNYRYGVSPRYKNATTITVSAGEIMIDGKMRRNTTDTDITWSGVANGPNLGLDTGTASSDTMYYIYAVADDAETGLDLIISSSATSPTGVTSYRLIGLFRTASSSTNIKSNSVASAFGDEHVVEIWVPMSKPEYQVSNFWADSVTTGYGEKNAANLNYPIPADYWELVSAHLVSVDYLSPNVASVPLSGSCINNGNLSVDHTVGTPAYTDMTSMVNISRGGDHCTFVGSHNNGLTTIVGIVIRYIRA